MRIVVASGGFDPIHSGHLDYLESARALGDYLVVGVNSDAWLSRKKGKPFQDFSTRLHILQSLKFVDQAMGFDDSDGSAISLIIALKEQYPNDEIVFANGGDRTPTNIPEMDIGGVQFEFSVGGNYKKNSSSRLLANWNSNLTARPWGHYEVLLDHGTTKVKRLVVDPGCSLSMQRHEHRSEHWYVTSGQCCVELEDQTMTLTAHQSLVIGVASWHRLYNPFSKPCSIIETQYGSSCVESDIQRRD